MVPPGEDLTLFLDSSGGLVLGSRRGLVGVLQERYLLELFAAFRFIQDDLEILQRPRELLRIFIGIFHRSSPQLWFIISNKILYLLFLIINFAISPDASLFLFI